MKQGSRRVRWRHAIATRLRSLANKLEPEHEVIVYVRPVIVGEDQLIQTVQMLTEIERRKLGIYQAPTIRPEWKLNP